MRKLLACLAIITLGSSIMPSLAIQQDNMFVVCAGLSKITVNGATIETKPPAYVSSNPKFLLEPRSSRLLVDSMLVTKIFPQIIKVFSSPSAVALTMPDYSTMKINVITQTCFFQNPGYPLYPCIAEAFDGKTFVSLKSVAKILGIETKWDEKTQSLSASWKQTRIEPPMAPMSRIFTWGVVNSVNITDNTFELRPCSLGKTFFKATKKLFGKLNVGDSVMVCYQAANEKQDVSNAIWAFKTDLVYGSNYTQFFAGSSIASVTGFARDLGCKPYMSGQTMMIPYQSIKSLFFSNSVSKWDGKSLRYTTSINRSNLVVTVGSNEIQFGVPEDVKTHAMPVATEIHDGQVCVSHEILKVIGAGQVKLDESKGILTVIEDGVIRMTPYAFWLPATMKLSDVDCRNGTASATDPEGRPWSLNLDMSAIDCSILAKDKEMIFQGFAYWENGQFKFYSDSILPKDFIKTKRIYDVKVNSYGKDYVIVSDSSKSEYVVKKPACSQMAVGSSWKCYAYSAYDLSIDKAIEVEPSSGKMIACGYFTCVQEGSQIYAADELGIDRRLKFPDLAWKPGKMMKKGLRYIVKFIENADKTLNVLDFMQTDSIKTGLSYFTGQVGQNDYRSAKPSGVSLKLEQPFVSNGILFVSSKVFRQYGVVMPGYQQKEVTGNLELVQFKAGDDNVLINSRKIKLSAAPIAIGLDLMVPFEDFSKIFAKAYRFDYKTGEFSVELYTMPTLPYSELIKLQITSVDAKNLTILGQDSHKKSWKVYFCNAAQIKDFQVGKVYQLNGNAFGTNEFVGNSNTILTDEKSVTWGMEPARIIMGAVSSVDVVKKTFTMTDTDGKVWRVKDNGSDLKLLSVGQKLAVQTSKDSTSTVVRRWTMKTLPASKFVKSVLRFNSNQLERDGKILKCKELDMIDGVLMFDVSMLAQMLPSSRITFSGDEVSVWHWGNTLIAKKGSDIALVDYQEQKLPAYAKAPLFELPVLWTLKNIGVKHNWDQDSKTLTVEEQQLPVPHEGNNKMIEITGKVVYSGIGLIKVNNGKRDILAYPSDLAFVANSKKNDNVWICAMVVGNNESFVYSDLVLPLSSKDPSMLLARVTKTGANGNLKCFEAVDKSGKVLTFYSSLNIKTGNVYKVTLKLLANIKNQFVATEIEGADQL